MLERHILIAGALFEEDYRYLVLELAVHVAIVKGVAAKNHVLLGKVMIEAALRVVLIGRLVSGEEILPYAAVVGRNGNVRQREEEIEIALLVGRAHQRIHREGGHVSLAVSDSALARIRIGHVGNSSNAKLFLDAFECAEKESFVTTYRTTEGSAEL